MQTLEGRELLDVPIDSQPGEEPDSRSEGPESESPVPLPDGPTRPPRDRWKRWWAVLNSWGIDSAALLGLALLVGGVILTFVKLRPDLIFNRATATGGDMGAHVWAPDFARRNLLGNLRPWGWSDDWYYGFPALGFYFPLPMWAIVALSYIMPYQVAFKLVTVLGILGLAPAMWKFGRLCKLPRPVPVLLGLSAFPFLFDRQWQIYGGNVLSTMAGEFSFSIALTLSFLFLGYFVHALRTGERRGTAAALLGATGLCHLLPTIFACIAALVIGLFHLRPERKVSRGFHPFTTAVVIAATGASLAAFWSLPFYRNINYTNDMGWEKERKYVNNLFPFWADKPPSGAAVAGTAIVLAAVAALYLLYRSTQALVSRRRLEPLEQIGMSLVIMAVGSALLFRFSPQFRLWNARVLPFWFIANYALAAFGLYAIGRGLSAVARWQARGTRTWATAPLAGTAVAGFMTFLGVGLPLNVVPDWMPVPKVSKGAIGVRLAGESHDGNQAPGWASYNYSGYERKAWPEYKRLMETMKRVGKTNGCGRAMWEYESEQGRFGTPLALMLLPYWTRSCIKSSEGLYFESSASTPIHFLTAALLTKAPSNPQRNLPYQPLDVNRGVSKLQQLGVRYYMAFSIAAQTQAHTNPDLRLITTAPYERACKDEEQKAQPPQCPTQWEIYEVKGSEAVGPLPFEPAVVTGIGQAQDDGWLDMVVKQFNEPDTHPVPYAASGPKSWQRVKVTEAKLPNVLTYGSGTTIVQPTKRPLPPVAISDIVHGNGKLRFHVDRVGVPVLVKISYFPNWKAKGAKGPYRVAPNLMVVIPTKNDVSMSFGRTPADLLGLLVSFTGIGVVFALRRGERRRQITSAANPPDHDDGDDAGEIETPDRFGGVAVVAELESGAIEADAPGSVERSVSEA